MSYYYQPDLELSCNNGDFFFPTVLMSFLIWGGGGSFMDQLVLHLQAIYPTEKPSQAWRREGKDTTPSFWVRKGLHRYISFQALCVQLTQKACKPTESTWSSDHGLTCHEDDQTGKGSRATSTWKGLSSKHFTAADQNNWEAGGTGIMMLNFNINISFPIQLAVHHCPAPPVGTDWQIPAMDSLEGSSNSYPHHTGDRPKQGPTLVKPFW